MYTPAPLATFNHLCRNRFLFNCGGNSVTFSKVGKAFKPASSSANFVSYTVLKPPDHGECLDSSIDCQTHSKNKNFSIKIHSLFPFIYYLAHDSKRERFGAVQKRRLRLLDYRADIDGFWTIGFFFSRRTKRPRRLKVPRSADRAPSPAGG